MHTTRAEFELEEEKQETHKTLPLSIGSFREKKSISPLRSVVPMVLENFQRRGMIEMKDQRNKNSIIADDRQSMILPNSFSRMQNISEEE
jgi:hypothetical protein